jgi:hypothetical protein
LVTSLVEVDGCPRPEEAVDTSWGARSTDGTFVVVADVVDGGVTVVVVVDVAVIVVSRASSSFSTELVVVLGVTVVVV